MIRPIFTSEALEAIYSYSGGLPRLINILCDNGLLAAYSLGTKRVRAEMIREVAEERSLTIQSKEEPRMKVAASMGIERPRPAGPVQQKIRRLGIIVDDAVAAEEPPVAQSSSEEFTVFTAGATTAEPAAGDGIEAEKERPVEPPATMNVETGERAEEVEAQFRVPPSAKEFTVFTAGAVTDEPPGLRETTEIEMERAFEAWASENGPPSDPNGRAGIDVRRGDFRVEDSTFAEFSAEGSPEFSTDTISDIVPEWFLDSLTGALTEAMGPMAPFVLRDLVSALGEELGAFPKSRAAELVESSSREILEESLKISFQQMMFKEIETMNSGKEEK